MMPLNKPVAAVLCFSLALSPGCVTRDRYINDCPGTRAEAEECADRRARRANLTAWGTAIGVLALSVGIGAAVSSVSKREYYRGRYY